MSIFGVMNRKGNFEDFATAQVSRAQSRRISLAPLGGGIGAVRQNRNFWTGKKIPIKQNQTKSSNFNGHTNLSGPSAFTGPPPQSPREQLIEKLQHAIDTSHDFYQEGGFYEDTDNAFSVDFTLDGWERDPTTKFMNNTFNDIPLTIMVDNKPVQITVDVYMNTASSPTNPLYNVGVKFLPENFNSSGFSLPVGYNFSIYNAVETTYSNGSSIIIINFSSKTDFINFSNYVYF